MSFPTVTMWCVGTMSSLVVTMTRRSGSGTAGDRCRLWVVEVGAGLLYPLPFSSHGAAEGTLGKRGSGGLCAGLGPLKAQLPSETCASFLLALGPTKGPCLGLANQDGEALFSHVITTF